MDDSSIARLFSGEAIASGWADFGGCLRIAMIGSRGLASGYSGIEAMLSELCPRLAALRHTVTVFGRNAAAEPRDGVVHVYAHGLSGKRSETLTRSLSATLQAAAARHDIFHFHDVAPGLFAVLPRLLGKPSVLTLHSLDWRRDKWSPAAKGAIKLIEHAAIRTATSLTAVSQPLADYVANRHGRTAVVLRNVVEPRRPTPQSAYSRQFDLARRGYVLFVGRLVPEKAPHTLIEAFQKIDTGTRLVLAGADAYSARYSRNLRARADPERILFTDHVPTPELDELYSNASLCVLPSLVEGCSMAALESLAHGTPVLASDTPENRDTLGSNGFFFAAGDVNALAAELTRLLTQPAFIDDMRGRLAARNESPPNWDELVLGYERVYRDLVKTGR